MNEWYMPDDMEANSVNYRAYRDRLIFCIIKRHIFRDKEYKEIPVKELWDIVREYIFHYIR